MSLDPVQRFLSVDRNADAAEMLGFMAPPQSSLEIDEALRRRLAEVYNHPDGRSEDAEMVRRVLREAAATLKSRLPRSAGHPQPRALSRHRPPKLTEFDRNVLAVLIGSGGWNATSRARLIAMAGANGVTAPGLLRVISGLGEFARRGHIDAPRIAAERGRTPMFRASAVPAGISEDVLVEFDGDVDDTASSWRTLQLAIVFGVIATILAVIVVKQLAPPIERRPPESPVAAAATAPAETISRVEPPPPSEPQGALYEHVDWGLAQLGSRDRTTFHAPTPDGAVAAARATESAVDDLDEVIRRLSVRSPEGPAEVVVRTWDDVLGRVASAWVILDESSLRAIERKILDALFTSGGRENLAAYQLLLSTLDPPGLDRMDEPLDLWRGAWRAGMLARIAFHHDLPAGVVEHAQERIASALGQMGGRKERLTFTQAAALWLDRAQPALVTGLSRGEVAFPMWEMWIAVQRRLGPHERFNGAAIDVVRNILISGRDLLDDIGDPTASLAVVGRLLDETDFNASRRAYERFLALMEDEAVPSEALWIVTSLLSRSAHAAWFDQSFVLRSPDSNIRRRLQQDIAAAWPEAAIASAPEARLRRTHVDPITGERWLRTLERIERESIRMDREDDLLAQVLRVAQLGEAAAYLAANTPVRAERVLDRLDPSSAGDQPAPSRSPQARQVGRPSGTEGGWAAAYEESRRDADERARLLRALRASAGGDLWPAEAAILVREAFRGTPNEIRNIAQGVIADAFGRGPIVAREMLDQLPDAQRTPALSEFLARFTGHSLPAQRDHDWMIAARLALIEHILSLLHSDAPHIERIADDLGASYAHHAGALAGAEPHDLSAAAPQVAAAALYDHWRERAHAHGASRLGEELAALDRRHAARLRLAEGPIQRTIALRIGALELMAIATRGEAAASSAGERGGGLDLHIAYIFESNSKEWRAAPSALLQTLWIERATNAIWRVRLNVEDAPAEVGFRTSNWEVHFAGTDIAPPDGTLQSPQFQIQSLISLISVPAALAPTADGWTARLEALDPANPLAYFELAEEIADAAQSPQEMALARRLFGLAGAFDPARLGRSACLALADLEEQSHVRRRYLALAELLARQHGGSPSAAPVENGADDSPERRAAALALAEAFSHYRQGNGTRAAQNLRPDEVRSLLHSIEGALPWRSAQTFINEVSIQRRRPTLNENAFIRMLQIEQILLGGAPTGSAGWATELAFSGGGGRPLIEVDPARLDEALNADITRPYFRDGRWVAQP